METGQLVKEFTNTAFKVLVSGWWMAARPWDVEARAQIELLTRLGAELGQRAVIVAWPRRASTRLEADLPTIPTAGGTDSWGRLLFEQVGLPRAAARLRPEAVLVPYASAPLASQSPIAATIESHPPVRARGLDRLRAAAAKAGLSGAWRLLQLADAPSQAAGSGDLARVSPAVPTTFRPAPADDDAARRRDCGMPPSYVLALGASMRDVRHLLAAWSWMAPSLGEEVRLAIGPLGPEAATAAAAARDLGQEASVIVFERLPWDGLPAVLRGASCLLVGESPASWQVLRWSLACGLPVAGVSSDAAQAILGEAGFLVPPGDARALGAASLSLLVDDEGLARRLKETGLARAASYHQAWGDGRLAAALSARI
jgi:glycosyltransferase involved in cell wall biosynthesis